MTPTVDDDRKPPRPIPVVRKKRAGTSEQLEARERDDLDRQRQVQAA